MTVGYLSCSSTEAAQAALVQALWDASGLAIPIRIRPVSTGKFAQVELDLCNDRELDYSHKLSRFFQRESGRSNGDGFRVRTSSALCAAQPPPMAVHIGHRLQEVRSSPPEPMQTEAHAHPGHVHHPGHFY